MSTYSVRSKLTIAILSFWITSLTTLTFPPRVFAEASYNCPASLGFRIYPPVVEKNQDIDVLVTISDSSSDTLLLNFDESFMRLGKDETIPFTDNGDGTKTAIILPNAPFRDGTNDIELELKRLNSNGDEIEYCKLGVLEISRSTLPKIEACNISFGQTVGGIAGARYDLACYNPSDTIYVKVSNIIVNGELFTSDDFGVDVKLSESDQRQNIKVSNGSLDPGRIPTFGPLTAGEYTITVEHGSGTQSNICQQSFTISGYCDPEDQIAGTSTNPQDDTITPFRLCDNIPAEFAEEKSKCLQCIGDGDPTNSNAGVWTALGCINYSATGITTSILSLAMGIGGGIALLLIIYGAFLINTAAGNPEQAQQGKEVISAAITGLLLIIFSVVLLNIIGVEILRIPGF